MSCIKVNNWNFIVIISILESYMFLLIATLIVAGVAHFLVLSRYYRKFKRVKRETKSNQ